MPHLQIPARCPMSFAPRFRRARSWNSCPALEAPRRSFRHPSGPASLAEHQSAEAWNGMTLLNVLNRQYDRSHASQIGSFRIRSTEACPNHCDDVAVPDTQEGFLLVLEKRPQSTLSKVNPQPASLREAGKTYKTRLRYWY
jgi:hypothetical protein